MLFSHILVFMAGASSVGALLASTTADKRSLAMPAAKRAMASAVAGAITMIIGRAGQADMANLRLLPGIEETLGHLMTGERLQGQRGDEVTRGFGHDHVNIGACLDQKTAELGGLVGGDAAGYAEHDGLAAQIAIHAGAL